MGWVDVTASDSVEAADWIRDRLHGFAKDVGSIVPPGFEAYARIFHPAWRRAFDLTSRPEEVRWSDIAAWNGKTVHPEMQFHSIGGPWQDLAQGQGPAIFEPHLGTLSPHQSSAITSILSRHTSTPDACWFCLWEGYGYLTGATAPLVVWHESVPWWRRNGLPAIGLMRRARPGASRKRRDRLAGRKRVRLPGRDYLLFTGSVAQARGWEDGPNLWWPDDRAWCVASEIDFPYTYVGGAKGLIEGILRDAEVEALPAKLSDGITMTSDAINS
ncbi:MAG TPA: hypothetical protein VJT78_14100 [Candidatus Dormibacteraeota bacterium]|nr:hypothetical protein [Candidatus Dormibacteraeota bacterium]